MSNEASLLSIFALLTGRQDGDGNALGPRRELTRQRIVAATTAQLLAHGYRQMRVDDVADDANVSRPTLYAYFESKEHLLIAAMSEEAMGQLQTIGPLFDTERSAEERLHDWVRSTVAYIVTAPLTARMARDRDPEVLRILLEHDLARRALGMNAELDKGKLFSGLVQEAFPGAFDDVEANEVASLLRAISHMAPTLLDEHAMFGLSVERMADLMATLLMGGMRARSTSANQGAREHGDATD